MSSDMKRNAFLTNTPRKTDGDFRRDAYAVDWAVANVADNGDTPVEDSFTAEIDRYLSTTTMYASSLFESVSDVHGSAYIQHQSPQHAAGLYEGVVKHCLPYFNTYRVAVAGLNSEIMCGRLMHDSSAGVLGVTDGSMISVGDTVLLHYLPSKFYGLIIGQVPHRCTDGNTLFSDSIGQGSNVGMHKDAVHQAYVTSTGDEGGAIDFNCHRPLDQLSTDWNRGFATGTLIHVDPFAAMMRTSEMCGVFFLPFEHARLCGVTMDIWSNGATFESGNEDGEPYAFYGEHMYQHEALGAFQPGTTTTRDVDQEKVIFDEPHGVLEPAQNVQKPFYRYEEYGGYEARGHIRQMQAPPIGASSELNTYSGANKPVTVIREHLGANGEYSLQFAKSGIFSKRSVIPSVIRKRMRGDDQEDSDTPDTYKAANTYGDGPEHTAPEVELLGEHKNLLAMTALADLHTYKINWKALNAFRAHKGDYRALEESEATGVGVNQVMPNYAQLRSRMWLERPSPNKLYVDQVEREVDIFALMSHIAMLDDGGLCFQAGDGSELRLGGGNAVLTAPNLVLLQSGGTTAIVAGDDAVTRARNSVDMTSAKKDVRIGAGKGMYFGSALDGKQVGGMLFDCRSYGLDQDYPKKGGEKIRSSGVVFKVPDSGIMFGARELYLRTCGPILQNGNIVIDCNDGNGDIVTASNNFRRFVKGSITDIFGFEKAAKVNDFNRSRALFCASLWADGSLRANGTVLARNSVVSLSGSMQTQAGGNVLRYRDPALYEQQLRDVSSAEEREISEGTKLYEDKIKKPFKEEKRVGHEETLKKMSFGMRTEEDCGTQGFVLPQTCWQVYADAGAGGMEVWEESPVKYQESEDTVAWPANEAWNERPSLLTLPSGNFGFFELEAGLAKAANGENSPYKQPRTGPYVRQIPKSNYKVLATGE